MITEKNCFVIKDFWERNYFRISNSTVQTVSVQVEVKREQYWVNIDPASHKDQRFSAGGNNH